ncbi:MAG: polysaccharide deacetylase family protein [Acidipila sp.]|nr:polysaccharide deacetylase family protein [Acidipila sp.]
MSDRQRAAPEAESLPNLPPAVIHVDCDGATDIYRMHGWRYSQPEDHLFASGMRNALEFFQRNTVRATLFVIASSLDDPRKRALLQDAHLRGHELASHSFSHPLLYRLTREEKRHQLADSREKMEAALGISVRGFRAPGYSIDQESVELLAQCGYTYDSSAVPNKIIAGRLNRPLEDFLWPAQPLAGSKFWELPLPDYRPSPVPFSPSYALLLGLPLFRWGLERFSRSGAPLVLLFHFTDLADPLPASELRGWKQRIFTLSHLGKESKLRRCQIMLDLVRKHFRIISTDQLLEELNSGRALPAPGNRHPATKA